MQLSVLPRGRTNFLLLPVLFLLCLSLVFAEDHPQDSNDGLISITNGPAPQFSILSYNLYLMPQILMSWGQKERVNQMLKHETLFKTQYDVIVLQEAFDTKTRGILLEGLRAIGYEYQTEVIGKTNATKTCAKEGPWDSAGGKFCRTCPCNGGVVIVSRHEIQTQEQFIYSKACGMDTYANKGFAYVKVNTPHYPVHIVGTHLQADCSQCRSSNPRPVRKQQLKEITKFIDEKIANKEIQKNELVLIAGDLNINSIPNPQEGEYNDMLEVLKAEKAMKFRGLKSTYDPNNNEIAGANFPGEKAEYLDHVLIRKVTSGEVETVSDTGSRAASVKNPEKTPSKTLTKMMKPVTVQNAFTVVAPEPYLLGKKVFIELSDHFPVEYTVEWEEAPVVHRVKNPATFSNSASRIR